MCLVSFKGTRLPVHRLWPHVRLQLCLLRQVVLACDVNVSSALSVFRGDGRVLVQRSGHFHC